MNTTATQEKIIQQEGNLIVRASAGTGKTYTLVSKLRYDLLHNKDYKVAAAITFTIKAAKEIKDRLKVDTPGCFIGTNNSFVIEEIIKPFMKDVFGPQYKGDIGTDYFKKVDEFNEGVEYILKEKTIYSYRNNNENFVFQLGKYILQHSKACRLYLKAKYFKIYIDEYQDCDKDMHSLFMYICDVLKINLFIVGDEKQSIYMWRGANPTYLMEVWEKENFTKIPMRENFRSCLQIQNYSNLLCEDTRGLYKHTGENDSIILIKTEAKNWVEAVVPYLDYNKRIALLRFRRDDAEQGSKELSCERPEFVYIPTTPIANITTEAAWLYNSIAKYFILKNYTEYDFQMEMPDELSETKGIIRSISSYMGSLKIDIDNRNEHSFIQKVMSMAAHFSYTTKEEDCSKLYETIVEEKYHSAFRVDEMKRISITFHSSKGLEFDQVILFVNDYCSYNTFKTYDHYVASTRAKQKLIMVCLNDMKSRYFMDNINKMLAKSDLSLDEIMCIVE